MFVHWIWILLLAGQIQIEQTAACGNTYFGENKPKDKDNEIESNNRFGYLMSESNYIIDCCGIVDGWEAYFDSVSGSRTVYFQVWRPDSGDVYTLMGENAFTVTSDGGQEITVPAAERITIRNNDKFGWWTDGNDVITYKKGGGEEDNNWLLSMGDISPGNTHDWSSKTVHNDRSYAVRMNVISNTAPTFTNLPHSKSITNDLSSGTSVYMVSVDDINPDDVSGLSVTMTTNSFFSFDTSTLIVSTSGSYATLATSTKIVELKVSDQCSNTATSTLTVTITNADPVIVSLPASTSLSEEETTEMLLHTFSATDTAGTPTCALAASMSAFPFDVRLKPASTDYGIYSNTNPSFDYDSKSQYLLIVECTDVPNTASSTFTVNLSANPPPVIVSLPASTSISEDATVETLLHTISVTDTRGTPTCAMASSLPASYPFLVQLVAGSTTDYGIYSQSSPGFAYATKPQYVLTVDCSDTKSTVSSTFTVDLIENPPPVIVSLPATASISEDATTETLLHTINVTDTTDTPTCAMASSVPATYPFRVRVVPSTSDYGIYSQSSPGFAYATKPQYVLTVDCSDPRNTVSAAFTVNLIENPPPVIVSLPNAASISEDASADTLLHTINVTDTTGTPTCAMASSVPATYPFQVRAVSSTTNYGIYSSSNPGFSFDTQNQYDLTIDCSDERNTVSGTFSVYLIRNVAPVFTNLQNSTSISTTSATLGSNVFTVLATDAESNSLTFNMTCTPSPCPFTIFNSGDIQVSTDLTGHSIVGYDLYIYVADARNLVGPSLLTVTFTDINDPVIISNLPLTSALSVSENTATGTSIYTVLYSDVDSAQSHTFTMTSSPGTGMSYFNIDSSSGVVSTAGTVMNYEHLVGLSTTTFTFTITVSDPVTSDAKTLSIDVVNVNEPPVFSQSSYSLSTAESVADTEIGTPSFGITDPDSGDSNTLSMNCGVHTAYFFMDSSSGQVKFLSNYDLDTGSLATTVTCTVTARDSGSLTATASLTILIADVNDNTPTFSPTAYTFYISYYSTAGASVGTVTATDADVGSFGSFTYSINQTTLAEEHFVVDSSGVISVKVTPVGSVMGYATSASIVVSATDSGGLSSSAPVVIVVSDTTTTSTTTTTERYRTFIEDNRNVAWLVACVVLLIVIIGTLLWIISTCHGEKGCGQFLKQWRRPNKKMTKRRRFRNRRQSYEVYSMPSSYPRDPIPSNHPAPSRQPVPPRILSHTVRNPPPPVGLQPWRSEV